jgi:GNAT superfamily N-acetyltransferase
MSEVRRLQPAERNELAALLDERSAADAMAAYYGLHHPADRLSLYVYQPTRGGLRGFLAVAQTGLDLFRPLAVPFVGQREGLAELLRAGLRPGRPVVLHIPVEQRPWALEVAELSDVRPAELLRLDMRRLRPLLNVLVVESQSPNGWPRYEIHAADGSVAAAGLNWKGPRFAEVYLDLDPKAKGRGFGASVLAAITRRLIEEKISPLYRVAVDDLEARAAAEELGFTPTGIQTLTCQAVLRSQPIATPARTFP